MATATDLKVKPLNDRVVVKPLEDGEQMRGGLYIPDTAKEKPQQGEIVASVGISSPVTRLHTKRIAPAAAEVVAAAHLISKSLAG